MHVFTSFLSSQREGILNLSPVKSNSVLIFLDYNGIS